MAKKPKRGLEQIKTDEQIEKDKKNSDHKRAQILADAMNQVSKIAIFLVPALFLLGFLIYIAHIIHIRDWLEFQNQLSSIGKYTAGGLLAWFGKNKLIPKP